MFCQWTKKNNRIILPAILAMMACAVLVSGCSHNASARMREETAPESVAESDVPAEDHDEDNMLLEQIYLESVHDLYAENTDLFGNEMEERPSGYDKNHFAICDIDQDGYLELILSWTDTYVGGMWGGVFQYDPEQQTYADEGLTEPMITFYDNGIAYEPWRHNQGPGEMWPFNASLYNMENDRYEHVLTADSWNRSMRPENFPEKADTDGVGVVYFTDINSDRIDYDHPISQTLFSEIYNGFFSEASEIMVTYYEISENGIAEYRETNP